jgi:hypothetical protein
VRPHPPDRDDLPRVREMKPGKEEQELRSMFLSTANPPMTPALLPVSPDRKKSP